MAGMNVNKIRKDFPFLKRKIVYFDNAASSQKPKQVVEAMRNFYYEHYANVHRGLHTLSEEATSMYEKSREIISGFIGAKPHELVFTKNSTEAINLVAYSWALNNLKSDDEIVVSILEHHANIVPWQFVCKKTGAKLVYLDIDGEGVIPEKEYEKINRKTRIVSITHVSNVLGTIVPVHDIAKIARDNGALFLVDGSQSSPHMPIDVKKIGCDFFAFTGHKMLGPSGIGGLYIKEEIAETIPPFLYGGDMIKDVNLYESVFADPPQKFEAGTPQIAEAIGLAEAVKYLQNLGMKNVREHEKGLTAHAIKKLSSISHVEFYGPRDVEIRAGVIPFNVQNFSANDVAMYLDEKNIAVRSGLHCAHPLHRRLGLKSTARASFYIYNTEEEIDYFVEMLEKLKR
ncbi:MAG: cysteine desulfurase [Candidatus Anstonellales archaeon]